MECPAGCACDLNPDPYTQEGQNTPKTLVGDEDDETSTEDEDEEMSTDDESDDEGDEVDEEYMRWADDPTNLVDLERLRWCFSKELKDPSAWTLQRIKSLIQSKRIFAARETVKKWLSLVATSTRINAEGELRLPYIGRPDDGMPFHRVLTWEEVEDREYSPERDIEEKYKREARLTISFLFPEAETEGLSTEDKKRVFTVASRLWVVHHLKAEALLWVLRKEYAHTRKGVVGEVVLDWPNYMAEDFMVYTALYPPPCDQY